MVTHGLFHLQSMFAQKKELLSMFFSSGSPSPISLVRDSDPVALGPDSGELTVLVRRARGRDGRGKHLG